MHQALRDAVAASPAPPSTDRRAVRTRAALRQALAAEIDATGDLTRVTVTAVTDEGSTVYAADDDSFTLTVGSNTPIGKVVRYISGTSVEVYFEAASFRSI